MGTWERVQRISVDVAQPGAERTVRVLWDGERWHEAPDNMRGCEVTELHGEWATLVWKQAWFSFYRGSSCNP